MFARHSNLNQHLKTADLVITGEGCIDRSTGMGKGAGIIALECLEKRIPCIAFSGDISARDKSANIFAKAYALTNVTTLKNAKSAPAMWLEKLASRAAGKVESD